MRDLFNVVNHALSLSLFLTINSPCLCLVRSTGMSSVSRRFRASALPPNYYGYNAAMLTGIRAVFVLAIWMLSADADPERGDRHDPAKCCERRVFVNLVMSDVAPRGQRAGCCRAKRHAGCRQRPRFECDRHRCTCASGGERRCTWASDVTPEVWRQRNAIAAWRSPAVCCDRCDQRACIGRNVFRAAHRAADFRARNTVEAVSAGVAASCCVAANILTTVAIVLSMLFETLKLLSPAPGRISPRHDMGSELSCDSELVDLPLLWAPCISRSSPCWWLVPIVLFAAIYLSEYAKKVRALCQPLLESSRAIPTSFTVCLPC